MTVIDFLRLTRRSWRVLVAFVVLGIVAMGVYTVLSPKIYQASASGFIVVNGSGAISGSSSDISRISAYMPLISQPAVIDKIAEDPTVDLHGENLSGRLSAHVVSGTTMIQVTATAEGAPSALALANGALKALVSVIDDIETAASGSQTPRLRVIPMQSAALPTVPISPNLKMNLLLGAVAGLILGYAFVFVRRGLETRIRSWEDLAGITNAGLLGAIPKLSKGAPSLDATDRESMNAAEAIRQIRTALSFSSVDRKVQSVAVTSANEEEGKTTVATQLAQVFARSGKQVVIIDADLRRPAVARRMGIENTLGLSELLSGQADLADVVQMTRDEGLYVITAGQTPPNPSEMLGSTAFRTLLAELASDHLVIVDAPPVLPVTDASLVAAAVDGVVFVALADKTKKPAVVAATRLLDQVQARILGGVLNMVPHRGRDHDVYGYYAKNYGDAHDSAGKGSKGRKARKLRRATNPGR